MKHIDLEKPTTFLNQMYLGFTQRECKPNKSLVDDDRKMFESRTSTSATEKLPDSEKKKEVSANITSGPTTWIDTERNAANKDMEQLYKVSTPSFEEPQFKKEEQETVEGLSKVCSHIFLKCLYLVRIGRPDILRSVSKLARAVVQSQH